MKNKKGFTLTEILIVMVVAGILLALILPNTLKAIERGNATALRNDVNSINTALFMCFSQERNWSTCNTFTLLTTPAAGEPYLADVPLNPFVTGATAAAPGYSISASANGTGFLATIDTPSGTYPADIIADIAAGTLIET